MTPKIQLIKYPPINKDNFPDIIINQITHFEAFDTFDYNLICLNNPNIFKYQYDIFEKADDFYSIKARINKPYSSEIVVILPQNKYSKQRGIKDELNMIYKFLKLYFNSPPFELIFEKNKTKMDNAELSADFYLDINHNSCEIITKNTNDNATTIKYKNIIYTTLNLENNRDIIHFIKEIEPKDIIDIPNWFDEIEMFDDEEKKLFIEQRKQEIQLLEEEINTAENKLEENNYYKSILYKQGKPLVKIVFKMLEEMLDYDLSEFKDVYKEDFLIKFNDITFIGEIKGVNSNVKKGHLGQLDDHVTDREDYLDENNIKEIIKPLLIINTFIKKNPYEREEVDKTTIKKAEEKYETLIITTIPFLKLYEKFKNNEITTEEIKNRFKDEIGLFKP
ncbi:hypothetical protein [Methanobrevibacter millerae]|uniref:Uncharacterized protein n=1 Tax=Methanobrevibacter millerae TaxID=230361 RepID=A0A0U3E2I7_9EURY|nr:hypothetical protein [Methanobrevibacter millerae]ALT68231.1 hypothetical protein sm9_0429 [Methanobrevibacter millerae]